tara:strand:- start:4716 stop:5900 length:1185 start_codon:yes stop_codon:yes gene_type:complete
MSQDFNNNKIIQTHSSEIISNGTIKKEVSVDKLYMDGTKLNRHTEEVLKWKNKEWFSPIHMELSFTNICNQKCTFCYTAWAHGSTKMSKETIINLIKSAKKTGVKSTLIAGEGEPTINPAYIDAIETCGEVGLDCALNTNAIKMNEKDLRRILPHLQWVRFSFQASEPNLYSKIHRVPEHQYHKAVENITLAGKIKKELGLDVMLGLQQVLIDENGADVYNTAKLAKKIGTDYYVIKPCHPHEHTSFKSIGDLVKKYKSYLEKVSELNDDKFRGIVRWNFLKESEQPRTYNRCLALPFIVQILADGEVSTCYPMAHDKRHLYGNLNDKSFEEIIKSEKFQKICNYVERNVDVHKCMPTCRQHNANKYLWSIVEEGKPVSSEQKQQEDILHLNFI